MGFLKRLFGGGDGAGPDGQPADDAEWRQSAEATFEAHADKHRVTFWMRLYDPGFETMREQQRVFALENELMRALDEAGVGEHDTNSLEKGYMAMRFVGPDAQAIVAVLVPLLAEAVMRMRKGDIRIDPGFDGEFGKVNIFSDDEKKSLKGEKRLSIEMGGEWQEELDIQFWFITGTPPRDVHSIQNIWPFRRGSHPAIQNDAVFEPRNLRLNPVTAQRFGGSYSGDVRINAAGTPNALFAQEASEDMYASIDGLSDKLDKLVRRHKDRIRGHHASAAKRASNA